MNKVHLIGDIGDRFGHEWVMNISNYSELLQLIDCQTKGFKKYLLECHENDINFTVQRADEYQTQQELFLNLNDEDVIITAIPKGAEETFVNEPSGWDKIIIGVILVYLAWLTGNADWAAEGWMAANASQVAFAMATMGVQLLQMGIAELQAPVKFGEDGEANLFQGPVTGIQQGIPVPVLYGELLVGGMPINIGFTTHHVNLSKAELHSNHQGGRMKTDSKGDFTAIDVSRRQKQLNPTLGGAGWNREG